MNEIIYPGESDKIMGACLEVYKEKGCGFLGAVYREYLEFELRDQDVPNTSQQKLESSYKGRPLKQTYEPDFICHSKISLEIKAVTNLTGEHRARVQNYLRATGHRLGRLVKFGPYPKVETERIAR